MSLLVQNACLGQNCAPIEIGRKKIEEISNRQWLIKHFMEAADENIDYSDDNITTGISFRNENLLNEHYQKHGIEMGFSSASEYEAAARSVVVNSKSLHKIEAEDGDDVYYLESSNELVIVSTDGYIRTYFKPNDGIAYYNRQ